MRRLLVQLSGLYLVAVAAFGGGSVLHDRPDWANAARTAAVEVKHAVSEWTEQTAASVHDSVTAWLDERTATRPSLRGSQPEEQPAPAAQVPVPVPKPVLARRREPAKTQVATAPQSPPLSPVHVTPERHIPDGQVAEAPAHENTAPHAAPHVDDHLPPADQIARVRERLRASLSSELYANFDLFLYISKADHGPWAQHMYVFTKEGGGLRMLHAWPVSTGREDNEIDVNGESQSTETPVGYYQLDPGRMLRHYTSAQWNAPMPFAMFFNWIDRGNATGLAIHGVEGEELNLLGTRASAGCIRLAPEAAQNLFNLIKADYRGLVPRFAMDHHRWSSTSNRGELMHDDDGALVRAQGYRVLVYVDGYGGDDMVSALY